MFSLVLSKRVGLCTLKVRFAAKAAVLFGLLVMVIFFEDSLSVIGFGGFLGTWCLHNRFFSLFSQSVGSMVLVRCFQKFFQG